MSRIGRTFRAILAGGGKAFIAYVMAGAPDLRRTREVVEILAECGVDILELGVPFSDPLADGPTIQRAAHEALGKGVMLKDVINLVPVLRQSVRMPIILMTYYNPVFRYGEERFVEDAVAAGVDGVIIPDLPPEEAGSLKGHAREKGLDTIFLAAPTSTDERLRAVVRSSSGFVYYVPMTGITGSRLTFEPSLESHIALLRGMAKVPIAVGFGIGTPEEAERVARLADGVIVGSAIVKRVHGPDDDLRAYLRSLRASIR